MMSMQWVTIAIADDHQIFREGLRRLLESERAFQVIAEAANGIEAARVAAEYRPDVMLLDVAMPHMGGLEALAAMPAATRVILLTAAIDPGELIRAIEVGARGVVLKESASSHLVQAIYHVMADKYVLGSGIAGSVDDAIRLVGIRPAARYGLTSRELEIVAAIVAGDSNRDIAERLRLSPETVKHHLTSIFDKTGMSTRLELAIFAIRNGLVRPD